jgi:hypothetical protein
LLTLGQVVEDDEVETVEAVDGGSASSRRAKTLDEIGGAVNQAGGDHQTARSSWGSGRDHVLFELISARYEQRLTSSLPISRS